MKLAFICSQLITSARLNRGATVHRTLKAGLRLDLCVKGSEYQLFLSRLDVYPSDIEIATVFREWPKALPPDEEIIKGERTYPNRWHSKSFTWKQP